MSTPELSAHNHTSACRYRAPESILVKIDEFIAHASASLGGKSPRKQVLSCPACALVIHLYDILLKLSNRHALHTALSAAAPDCPTSKHNQWLCGLACILQSLKDPRSARTSPHHRSDTVKWCSPVHDAQHFAGHCTDLSDAI